MFAVSAIRTTSRCHHTERKGGDGHGREAGRAQREIRSSTFDRRDQQEFDTAGKRKAGSRDNRCVRQVVGFIQADGNTQRNRDTFIVRTIFIF